MKKYSIACSIILLFASLIYSAEAQTQYSTDAQTQYLSSDASDEVAPKPSRSSKPSTTLERLESTTKKYHEVQAEILVLFNGMAADPQTISSKETVKAIDLGDRALKRAKSSFDSIRSSLRADMKKIKEDSYFTDAQKTELIGSIDTLAKQCEEKSLQAASTIQVLARSYKLMPKWRNVYRTYLDLDGEAKASEHLKVAIDGYVGELTAKPEVEESEPKVIPAVDTGDDAFE